MIIEKKNSIKFNNTNSPRNIKQDIYENKTNKQILVKKPKLNINENMPIKVHVMGRNSKNEKKNNSNLNLISSFNIKNKYNYQKNEYVKLGMSSSFHKRNFKVMIGIPNGNSQNKNEDEPKMEVNKLKELLNNTKDLKINNNILIKNNIIPINNINNIKRYETEDKENQDYEKNLNDLSFMNKSVNANNKKRNILNLRYHKNINKEKIYNLVFDKNKNKDNKINNNNENNNNNDINDNNNIHNFSKTEQKQKDISKHKIRNILSKNFAFHRSKPNCNTLDLLSINNSHTRTNKFPEGLSYIKTVNDYEKNKQLNNNKETNENTEDTNKITISNNIRTNTINTFSPVNNNNIQIKFDNINKKNSNFISSFQLNDKGNIKSRYFNSPQKWNNNIQLLTGNSGDNLKLDINKSVEIKNKINKFKPIKDLSNIGDKKDKKNINSKINEIEIKFDDLIFYEEKLNDIYIATNTYDNMEDGAMNNECLEFFYFYFNSSLNNKLFHFFSEENYIIIQSSINLQLFIIMFIYHLFFNSQILNESICLLIDIFNKFKINFYLLIKQVSIYYNNIKFFDLKNNNIYFNILQNLLNNTKIYNIKNLIEDEIILKINDNCTNISNNIHKLLNTYYEYTKNNNQISYYNEFMNIFNQISIITENDIKNYFYNIIYKENDKTNNNNGKKVYNIFLNYKHFNNNKNYRNSSPFRKNISETNSKYKNIISFSKDSNINNNNIIENEKNQKIINDNKYISVYRMQNNKNNTSNINNINNYNEQNSNIIPPFIKTKRPSDKKYTLVLDLDETLVYVKQLNTQNNNNYSSNSCNNINQKIINLRPGLFAFLNNVKPFYEIISFSSASKLYADHILNKIETNQKYFDHNLYRQHTTLYGKEYVKDISKIGRNIKEIIIVDNLEKNFKLNPDNGVKIASYFGEIDNGNNDNKLFELQKLLILFYKLKYEDLRMAIKDYSQYIREKISTPD